jgi:hypothetical protein
LLQPVRVYQVSRFKLAVSVAILLNGEERMALTKEDLEQVGLLVTVGGFG